MATSGAHRTQKHRDKLRAAGLRPVQIWVPDTRRSGFAEACRHHAAALAGDPQEREILDWIEAAGDTDGWR